MIALAVGTPPPRVDAPRAQEADDAPAGGRASAATVAVGRSRLGWRHVLSALTPLVALTIAVGLLQQESGPNQAAHFALVRALPTGTAQIDPHETIDAAYIDGKYYAAKAPGLALATAPAYVVLRRVGLQDASLDSADGYRTRLWQTTLFGALLPALVLASLILVAVERLMPGYGAATAVLLGAGTLLLPFSSLLFAHVLAACLGFAAFVVLLVERDRGPSRWLAGASGMLGGLAVVVEFGMALVTVMLLALIAATGSSAGRRLAAFGAGALIGLLPLAAFNLWAFGSVTTLGYTNALTAPVTSGTPSVGANASGFFGVGVPDPRAGLALLFAEKGLLVVAPVCAVAVLGLSALWRSGRRAEAFVCGAVPAVFLVYNAAYYLPFGGQGPGPRFLVPALPFLALPLAAALRTRPLLALSLGVVSIGVMAVATFTGPLTGVEYGIGTWLERLGHGDVVKSVLSGLGIDGLMAVMPSAVLLAVAVGLAFGSLRPISRNPRTTLLAATACLAWLVVARAAPRLVPADEANGTSTGALAVVVLTVSSLAGLALVERRGAFGAATLAPLTLLLLPWVHQRQRVALLVGLGALALVTGAWVSGRQRSVSRRSDLDQRSRLSLLRRRT